MPSRLRADYREEPASLQEFSSVSISKCTLYELLGRNSGADMRNLGVSESCVHHSSTFTVAASIFSAAFTLVSSDSPIPSTYRRSRCSSSNCSWLFCCCSESSLVRAALPTVLVFPVVIQASPQLRQLLVDCLSSRCSHPEIPHKIPLMTPIVALLVQCDHAYRLCLHGKDEV